MIVSRLAGTTLLLAATLATVSAPDAGAEPNPTAQVLPGPLPEVGFDQKLGNQLPLDAVFRDESGQAVTLGDYFGERPVVVVPVYYDCPMLCSLVLNGLATTLKMVAFDAGDQFEVVAFSFDPAETAEMAREEKAATVNRYGREGTGDGFHFLTGDAASIDRLTEAIGFRYAFEEETGEFAHAAGVVVATPNGVVARTYYGIEIPPRDLRLGLVEAADEKIGSLVDQVLLYCYRYDPSTGQYSAVAMAMIRVGAVVTLIALALLVTLFLVRERAAATTMTEDPAGTV